MAPYHLLPTGLNDREPSLINWSLLEDLPLVMSTGVFTKGCMWTSLVSTSPGSGYPTCRKPGTAVPGWRYRIISVPPAPSRYRSIGAGSGLPDLGTIVPAR